MPDLVHLKMYVDKYLIKANQDFSSYTIDNIN